MIRDRFLPLLQAAGIRAIRFHDLRHTFGAMLIAAGAPLNYVEEQMGHASIQVTVDTYGHLIPGVGERYVDRLDAKTSQQQSATQAQPASDPEKPESLQVIEMIGSGGADRTPDLGIMRGSSPSDSKANQQVTSADSEQLRQNPQPRRNQNPPSGSIPDTDDGKGGEE